MTGTSRPDLSDLKIDRGATTGDSTPNQTLDVAELAAWTMVANTLMNRDDFINK